MSVATVVRRGERPKTRGLPRRAAESMPTAVEVSVPNVGAALSACSEILERLQFEPAFLTKGTQRIHRMTGDQGSQLRERFVWCEISVDNHSDDRLGLFDDGSGRHDAHLAYQRVNADQGR